MGLVDIRCVEIIHCANHVYLLLHQCARWKVFLHRATFRDKCLQSWSINEDLSLFSEARSSLFLFLSRHFYSTGVDNFLVNSLRDPVEISRVQDRHSLNAYLIEFVLSIIKLSWRRRRLLRNATWKHDSMVVPLPSIGLLGTASVTCTYYVPQSYYSEQIDIMQSRDEHCFVLQNSFAFSHL